MMNLDASSQADDMEIADDEGAEGWTLRIHHIDVGQGEATLIQAIQQAPDGAIINERAALIDGGLYGQREVVHSYLARARVRELHVMVATHYDRDHYQGLRGLLETPLPHYQSTVVFDQGEQGDVSRFGAIINREDDYIRYRNAIVSSGARFHATAAVPKGNGQLVNQEIFWRDVHGAPIDVPPNAPTITCVAANQHVASPGGSLFVFGGLGVDERNQASLAFLVTFNRFRYYTGGDLESRQEDQLAAHLGAAGPVHAMKASHHGSQHSTSQMFLDLLQPHAVFISCGAENNFEHPTQAVIDRLHGTGTIQNYYMTACGYEREHVPASNNAPQAGAKARVAGSDRVPGHIVLSVTQAQSTHAPPQFDVTYWDWDEDDELVVNHGP